jgi:hypothetical protein
MSIVYVRLLGEGTDVYRPVPAERISSNVFILGGQDILTDDEVWEFSPGTKVRVATKMLSKGQVSVVAGLG